MIEVFVSVGTPHSPAQEQFIAAVEEHLLGCGLRPRTAGRNAFSDKEPVYAVLELMERCSGVLVVALERVAIVHGIERRAGGGLPITGAALATPWNQIEAAIACARGKPLLVVRERGVKEEGLLEARFGWSMPAADLDPGFLRSADFTRPFERWRGEVARAAGLVRLRS